MTLAEAAEQDRELAWAPYLIVPPSSPVKNIGRGPALNCHRVERTPVGIEISKPFHLGPGDHATTSFGQRIQSETSMASLLLDGIDLGSLETDSTIFVCEDQFGNRYRFHTGGRPREVGHVGEVVPNWAQWRYYATLRFAPLGPVLRGRLNGETYTTAEGLSSVTQALPRHRKPEGKPGAKRGSGRLE
jgi:hypothetical protein